MKPELRRCHFKYFPKIHEQSLPRENPQILVTLVLPEVVEMQGTFYKLRKGLLERDEKDQ
jgi:hypothetical protein